MNLFSAMQEINLLLFCCWKKEEFLVCVLFVTGSSSGLVRNKWSCEKKRDVINLMNNFVGRMRSEGINNLSACERI